MVAPNEKPGHPASETDSPFLDTTYLLPLTDSETISRRFRRRPHRVPTKVGPSPSCLAFPGPSLRTASGGRPHGEPIIQQPKYLHSHRYTPPRVSYILVLFNLAIWPICPIGSRNVPVPEVRSPDTLPACRMHAEYPLANLDDDMI